MSTNTNKLNPAELAALTQAQEKAHATCVAGLTAIKESVAADMKAETKDRNVWDTMSPLCGMDAEIAGPELDTLVETLLEQSKDKDKGSKEKRAYAKAGQYRSIIRKAWKHGMAPTEGESRSDFYKRLIEADKAAGGGKAPKLPKGPKDAGQATDDEAAIEAATVDVDATETERSRLLSRISRTIGQMTDDELADVAEYAERLLADRLSEGPAAKPAKRKRAA